MESGFGVFHFGSGTIRQGGLMICFKGNGWGSCQESMDIFLAYGLILTGQLVKIRKEGKGGSQD